MLNGERSPVFYIEIWIFIKSNPPTVFTYITPHAITIREIVHQLKIQNLQLHRIGESHVRSLQSKTGERGEIIKSGQRGRNANGGEERGPVRRR